MAARLVLSGDMLKLDLGRIMVWFGKLDVPAEVVDAHRAGELVFFVGAGASIAQPSGMPKFLELTREIAVEAGLSMPRLDEGQEPPDVTLGRVVEECKVNVHARIATKISVPGSVPNATHRAVAALVASTPNPRLVTTNYDVHLNSALHDLGVTLEQWNAPALPVGDNFQGIVYLHGVVSGPPERLVATDEDFGRAYLREAWATRFLEPMFSEYPVLFIGYSHRDAIMTYLGRGLRSNSRRWILTDEPQSPLFRRLRIAPIGFARGHFEEQERGLRRWAELAKLGLLGHQSRVAELVADGPPEVPEDASYLEATVADAVRVRFFTEQARGEPWLQWTATLPEMKALFSAEGDLGPASRELTYWFGQHMSNPEYSAAALAIVRDRSRRVHPELWMAIARALMQHQGPRPAWLAPWLTLLLRDHPALPHQGILEILLRQSRLPEDTAAALALVEHLLRPLPAFQRGWDLIPGVRVEITFACDQYMLDEGWKEVLRPHLPALASELLPIALSHLRSADRILTASGASSEILSYGRSAIEPHPQDQFREPIDTLIDIARDSVQSLLQENPDGIGAAAQSWLRSGMPLLRRLAIHTWVERADRTADQKLEWLSENALLWDISAKHEVFRLIARALPEASPQVADGLVAEICAGPPIGDDTDDDHSDYQVFNALVWVLRASPMLQSAQDSVERLRGEHSKWEARGYPDLNSWISDLTDDTSNELGLNPAALADQFAVDASGAFEQLRALRLVRETERLGWPSDPAADVVIAMVSAEPASGVLLITADSSDEHGLHQAVISGWQRSLVSVKLAEAASTVLLFTDLEATGYAISSMLVFSSASQDVPGWLRSGATRELARAVWDSLPDETAHPPNEDDGGGQQRNSTLNKALNTAAGRIADYWVETFRRHWMDAGDDWRGLPAEFKMSIEHTLDGSTDSANRRYAEAIYVSHFHLFWLGDRAWCARHLLPLLDWETNPAAADMWASYLMTGRWNDDMLDAGLLQQYLATAARFTPFSSRREAYERGLPLHLAAITLDSTLDLASAEWLPSLTRTLPPETMVRWFEAIGRILLDRPGEAAEQQWSRWMRSYLQDRIADLPRPLSAPEASAASLWLINLDASFDEAVSIIERTDANLDGERFLLHQIDDATAGVHPTGVARLLAHLLKNTLRIFDAGNVARLYKIVRVTAPAEALEVIRAESLRLGLPDPER